MVVGHMADRRLLHIVTLGLTSNNYHCRPLYMFFVTKLFPWTKSMEMMGRCIAQAMAHEQVASQT